jgi:hypothetical protein
LGRKRQRMTASAQHSVRRTQFTVRGPPISCGSASISFKILSTSNVVRSSRFVGSHARTFVNSAQRTRYDVERLFLPRVSNAIRGFGTGSRSGRRRALLEIPRRVDSTVRRRRTNEKAEGSSTSSQGPFTARELRPCQNRTMRSKSDSATLLSCRNGKRNEERRPSRTKKVSHQIARNLTYKRKSPAAQATGNLARSVVADAVVA